MKRSTKETLRLAVEQLFARIHNDLFNEIFGRINKDENEEVKITQVLYDLTNKSHVKLVKLCKEKLGYGSDVTDQDIFLSIQKIYLDAKERDRLILEKERAMTKKEKGKNNPS